MPSNKSQCACCLRDGEVALSSYWCTDCSETLCMDCKKYHKKSKATTKHKIVPIDKLSDLSPALLNMTNKCKIHIEQPLAFFCVTHDIVCCASCIPENHKQCIDLITLDNGAENIKKSKFIEKLESRIQETKSSLDLIIKKKDENKLIIDEQKSRITAEIRNIRKNINDHFDKIEKHLFKDLDRAHESSIKTLDDGIKQIRERMNKMDVWCKDIVTLKENGSDVHIFTVVKTIHPLQTKQEAYLQTLQDEYTKLNIEFIEEEVWRHLISEVPSIGEIVVTETTPSKAKEYVRFKRSQHDSVSSVRHSSTPSKRKYIFQTSKLEKGIKIRNGCFLPDNRLILASFHENCVYICNKNGEKKKKIALQFKPSDMILYDAENIIFANGKSIQSWKIDSWSLNQHITDLTINDLIATSNNQIAIRSSSGALSVFDMTGRLLRHHQTNSYGSVAIDRFGRVYYSNNAKNEVYCFYPSCSHSCIYRHEELKDPSGMATDEHGNVYVAGHMSHNIHKISGQGKQHSIILSREDGIYYPQRIVYDDKTRELLVINCEWQSVEIYQV